MLLVIGHSQAARQALRNAHDAHPDAVVRRYGRVALLEPTGLGAFLALRLRAEHGGDVQVERTVPFNEFADVPDDVREAAAAYAERDESHTPYHRFAAGTDHPDPDDLSERELWRE